MTDEDTPFEVKAGSTEPITVISVENEAAKGRATIVKTCSEDGEDPEKARNIDVVAQEDIYSPTGSLQAGSGEVLDHVTTGKDGAARAFAEEMEVSGTADRIRAEEGKRRLPLLPAAR